MRSATACTMVVVLGGRGSVVWWYWWTMNMNAVQILYYLLPEGRHLTVRHHHKYADLLNTRINHEMGIKARGINSTLPPQPDILHKLLSTKFHQTSAVWSGAAPAGVRCLHITGVSGVRGGPAQLSSPRACAACQLCAALRAPWTRARSCCGRPGPRPRR